jgi:Uncharacterized protein conserved in bacteria (DUF2188)
MSHGVFQDMTTTHEERTVFHVATHEGKWVVTRERRPKGEFDAFETKDEAIARARSEAQDQSPSQVKIHRTDGTIEQELTFGDS